MESRATIMSLAQPSLLFQLVGRFSFNAFPSYLFNMGDWDSQSMEGLNNKPYAAVPLHRRRNIVLCISSLGYIHLSDWLKRSKQTLIDAEGGIRETYFCLAVSGVREALLG